MTQPLFSNRRLPAKAHSEPNVHWHTHPTHLPPPKSYLFPALRLRVITIGISMLTLCSAPFGMTQNYDKKPLSIGRQLQTPLIDDSALTSALSPSSPSDYWDAPALDSLSLTEERQLGRHIMREIRQESYYIDDLLLSDYINEVARALIQKDPLLNRITHKIQLFPVKDNDFNAFALPGGFIGIHTGLLLACEDESELASVIAHELGHVKQRHIAQMLAKQGMNNWIQLASFILGALAASHSPDASSALIMGGQALSAQRFLTFSNQAEHEADRIGFNSLIKAGYDPFGMLRMMQRMEQKSNLAKLEQAPYWSTHPLTINRIAELQNRLKTTYHYQKSPLPVPSLRFALAKIRAQVLQANSDTDRKTLETQFTAQIANATLPPHLVAAYQYGLALSQLLRQQTSKAALSLKTAQQLLLSAAPAQTNGLAENAFFDLLEAQIMVATPDNPGKNTDKRSLAKRLAERYPNQLAAQIAQLELLFSAQVYDEVIRQSFEILKKNADNNSPQIWLYKARSHSALGQRSLQHWAYGEYLAQKDEWEGAQEQFRLALAIHDANSVDMAQILSRQKWINEQAKAFQTDKPSI